MTGKEFIEAVSNAQRDIADILLDVFARTDSDEARLPSKRQKDLADIVRLVESHPELAGSLPPHMRDRLAL